ncbi:cysteine hydrolase [Holdemanella sp. SCCA2]|nr:cysteine hydrolase [Holdemanella sp. SCCA2]
MKKREELTKLLVVVDMVNGFIKEGKMSDKDINHITPRIKSLVESFLSDEEGVAFIKDTHEVNSTEFKKYPPHCLKGTSESELISELSSYEQKSLSYEKNSTSTIFAKNFMRDIERMESLKEVIITGCCTDICVMNLAIPLVNYFDEENRDVRVLVPQNAVETFNSNIHNRDEYNSMALKLMKNQGIGVENI